MPLLSRQPIAVLAALCASLVTGPLALGQPTDSVQKQAVLDEDVEQATTLPGPSSEPASRAAEENQPSAQPGAVEPAPTSGAAISAQELSEIEAALGQDTAQQKGEENQPEQSDQGFDLMQAVSGLTAGNELNPALSFIGDFALAYFSAADNLQRGGHDPTTTGFNLQQLELSMQAAVDPYFTIDANIVFSLFGVEIEEVYGTTMGLPLNLQLRVGQFLSRFGRINPTHPHSWAFVDQPLAIGKFFGSEGHRGLGVELSSLLPLPWYVEPVISVMSDSGGASCRSFYGNDTQPFDGPEDAVVVAALKQFWPLGSDWSLSFGLSGAFGPNATGRGNRSEIYGTDLYLKWRPISYGSYTTVSLETEWLLRRRQVPGDVLQDVAGYTQVFWRFARRWAAAARYEFSSGVQGDTLDPDEISPEHRVAANVTFWPTEFSRLRLQYSADVPTWRHEVVHAVFFAVELVAGAHGAHKF